MTILNPCPFCGGEVSIALCGDGFDAWWFITRGHGENACKCRLFMESEKFNKDSEMADFIADDLIAAWNRRADARQLALKTRVCPMCEDCPDGCPVETPKDSRNIVTNADAIRSMSDGELARWLVDATVCERACDEDEYCHGNECVKRVTDWLRQPGETEGTE